jgi:hypothetical protein
VPATIGFLVQKLSRQVNVTKKKKYVYLLKCVLLFI